MKGRTRRVLIVVGSVLGVIVVAGIAVVLAFRDTATPVSQEDVSESMVTVAGAQPGDYGVYVYATTGFEETDALLGARHEYPAETYMTVQPGGCGTIARWQPLEERWTEWEFCDDGTRAGATSFNTFFGTENLVEWECPERGPIIGEPGETWSESCVNEEREATTVYEVIGYETMTVGGQEVEAVHLRTTESGSGSTVGSGVHEIWLMPETNLILRRTRDYTSVNDTVVGPVTYHEQYDLVLTSLLPGS
jgi:hypothetical protein